LTAVARHNFDAQDVVIACLVALLAQLGFVAVFSLPSPKLVQVEFSNDNAQPIAVAITPVLKLGSKTPGKLPSKWTRRPPPAAKTPPQQAALPSTQAEKTAEAIPKSNLPDASVAPVVEPLKSLDSNLTAPADAAPAAAAAASTEGSEQGAANGTETDALKGRAADMYRAQLAAWFASHFQIRGKVPFDQLKTLHATATVTVTADRKVGSFTIVKPSGDATFDDEVKATLARVQSSGTELPSPPPLYPDLLGQSLPVGFQCTVRRLCE
jgi:outer membrane biosynthesis protein TonB